MGDYTSTFSFDIETTDHAWGEAKKTEISLTEEQMDVLHYLICDIQATEKIAKKIKRKTKIPTLKVSYSIEGFLCQ